jgi:hypothetical protein
MAAKELEKEYSIEFRLWDEVEGGRVGHAHCNRLPAETGGRVLLIVDLMTGEQDKVR